MVVCVFMHNVIVADKCVDQVHNLEFMGPLIDPEHASTKFKYSHVHVFWWKFYRFFRILQILVLFLCELCHFHV
jgi:hypothetical protein